jgi:hypothetical protein
MMAFLRTSFRVPDAVQRLPGDAKHRPVTMFRRAGTHPQQRMDPGTAAHHFVLRSIRGTRAHR